MKLSNWKGGFDHKRKMANEIIGLNFPVTLSTTPRSVDG